MEAFDCALEGIFENGPISLYGLEEEIANESQLKVPLSAPTITVIYPVDRNETLPYVSVTYTQDQIVNVEGLFRAIHAFYYQPLTFEQRAALKLSDPNNDANYVEDVEALVYDALMGSDGCRTDILMIDRKNGQYQLKLDWSC